MTLLLELYGINPHKDFRMGHCKFLRVEVLKFMLTQLMRFKSKVCLRVVIEATTLLTQIDYSF